MAAIPLDHSYSSTEPAPDPPGRREEEADNSDEEDGCMELPTSRIDIIMKSCLGIRKVDIPEDTLMLVSKCTELFIKDLTQTTFEMKKQEDPSTKSLDYEALSNVVERCPKFEFLSEIVPKKITFAQCKELLRKKEIEESDPNWKPPKPIPRRPRKKKEVGKKPQEKLPEPALVPLQSHRQESGQWPPPVLQKLPMSGSQWLRGPNTLNLPDFHERMPFLPSEILDTRSSQMMTLQPSIQTGQAKLRPQRKMTKQKPKQPTKNHPARLMMMPEETSPGISGNMTFQAPGQMGLRPLQSVVMMPEDIMRAREQKMKKQVPRHLSPETTVMMPEDIMRAREQRMKTQISSQLSSEITVMMPEDIMRMQGQMVRQAPRQLSSEIAVMMPEEMMIQAPRQMTVRAPRQVRMGPPETTMLMPKGMMVSTTGQVLQNQEQITTWAPEQMTLQESNQMTMRAPGSATLQEIRQMAMHPQRRTTLQELRQMMMHAPGHTTLQEQKQMTMHASGHTSLQEPRQMTMQALGHTRLQEPNPMRSRTPGQMTARPLGWKMSQMPKRMSMPAPRRMPMSTPAQEFTTMQVPQQIYEPHLEMAAQTLVLMSKSKPIQIPYKQPEQTQDVTSSEEEEEQ